jgi:hypothetical protein
MRLSISKKPGQIGQIEAAPKTEETQVVFATRAHHGKEAPKGESGQAQPEGHPVKSEEAEKSERCRGYKSADLGGVDGVEIEILDFGPDERAFPQGLVQTTLDKASMDTSEVDKVEIETGLGSCGDDEQGNKGHRHRAVPKKAANHENEKEV